MHYAAFASLMSLTSASVTTWVVGSEDEKKTLIKQDLQGVRKFYDAYMQSLYNVDASEGDYQSCLDEESLASLESVIYKNFDILAPIHPSDWYYTQDESSQAMAAIEKCHPEESLKDLAFFCLLNCDYEKIYNNAISKESELLEETPKIIDLMKKFPAEDQEEFEVQMTEIGKIVGTSVRDVLGFEKMKWGSNK